ncbi:MULTISPECIES: carbapenem-hydrolyzing class D beta-lactamase OXA-214 [Acinetobacter]|uniref:Beta-lactamase n=1 Tax=Acinetobacter haemolyticus TaxID=29430 RepID=G9JKW0_ACIHA|nr:MULTISPECIES: carbapenem-hydrolyzing class D beta-lactamase OXA-214 [Acinetobacter]AEV91553.1 beta-lactamase OXA-214 [Acinetobacter haemolyticus]EEH68232.1 penicillin-binding protein, transpeptidase domain protein [Acinetobacter sp. ATCC 27244]MCU4386251.1 carbapenem-hydrolyzing class D beta-lactamase OXA-214 [Acinetobacter haemolyticus]NAR50382.1 carbapenem-hydrolyzing class D beta-lactamase OXA-214 [Acinetobacter haemolyticus]NAR63475.1 carbapenem-hydrolyzing class D beta-lactamase OXA-21
MKLSKLYTLTVLIGFGLSGVACQHIHTPVSFNQIENDQTKQIASLFENVQTTGVLITFDGQAYKAYGNDLNRAKTAYIPASTFKILNALIGIEHDKTSPNEVFKWDGQKRAFESWEKDLTLAEAMQASAVPVYQALAQRIGLDLMAKEVKRVGFGNTRIGTQVDNFWLIGPLKITPIEEAQFAYRLAKQELPFTPKTQQQVIDMLLVDEIRGTKVYAKSGWGMDITPQVGWWTGWIEDPNGKVIAFSLNMEMNQPAHAAARKEIVYQALTQLKLL